MHNHVFFFFYLSASASASASAAAYVPKYDNEIDRRCVRAGSRCTLWSIWLRVWSGYSWMERIMVGSGVELGGGLKWGTWGVGWDGVRVR